MKAFKFTPLRSIYILFSFIATTTAALADGPNIITPNPNTATAELGSAFGPYQIVTDQDGSGSPDAPVLYNAQGLPPGLLCDAFTGEITGTPTVSSLVPFTVTLSATDDNDFTGTEGTLLITVNDPAIPPAITSALAITAPAGQSYAYTITASNNPISFSVVGLSAMETVGSASINPLTGIFSFTPSDSGVGDSINLIIKATYEDGSFVREILRVTISAAATTATIPDTITVDPNLSGSQFDPKQTSTIYVSADVTPATGATISSVVAVWTNPSNPDGTPLDPIILAELVGPAAGGGFSGTINIGFDPLNRELGGGNIDLELRAYQINAVNSADFLSGNVSFVVAPLLDVFVPDDNLLRSALDIDDEFAGARVNTNEFGTVTAFISGPGIVESLTVSSPTSDGIYFFATPQEISFPGIYQVRVEVTDNLGLSAVIERQLFITETLGDPVAAITAPLPGFTNEVFSPAVISYSQSGAPVPVTIGSGATTTIIGYNITYALNLVSAGQGYYPRNGTTSAPVTATVTGGITGDVRNITGIGFSNGRVDSLPATTTYFFTEDYDDDDDPTTPGVREPRWITPGNAILDDLRDPGTSGKITITGQFFRANAPLDSFEISVNGEEYLSGNLNPSLGVGTLITGEEYEILTAGTTDFTILGAANNDAGTTFTYNGTPVSGTGTVVGEIDVPIFDFPADGSPDPGDYVVTAQVIDQEGKVGNAFPVSFQILPYEPLAILLTRQVAAGTAPNDPVTVGSSATFLADINPINEIESVEFFESTSGDKLGDGSRVQIGGQEFYRCALIFPDAGDFEVYAFATGFNGQTVNSAPIEITVESGEFPEVSITAPLSNSDVPAGDNLEILINANDPDGEITVVEVFNGSTTNPDNLLGTATPTGFAGQYRLNFTPAAADAGVLNLIARATDDLGNSTDSDVALIGVVLGAVPVIEILSPSVQGTEFFVGQPFEIRARITDATPGGSITSVTLTDVNFYTRVEGVNGTILIVNDSISFGPQNDVMSQSSTPDEYVYMATINSPDVVGMVITATDNSGNVTQSAPFEFTVTNGIVPDVAITAVNSTVLGEVSVEPLLDGVEYEILTAGTTDFATLGPVPVNEDSLVTGQTYQIVTAGTDFTTAGAPSNAVGTVFIAGPIASTGSTGAAIDISVGTVFTSNGTPGAGTGTVLRSSTNPTHSNAIAVEPLIVGMEYEIVTVGTTDFATLGSIPINEDSLIPGQTYQIVTEGTGFTTAGAPSNAVGTVFTAGSNASTGSTGTAIDISVGTTFTYDGTAGTGSGTVRISGAISVDIASVVTLEINASDADDDVSQVEVLNNGIPLGFANLVKVDSTVNPTLKKYRFDYYTSSAGMLNFQARAADNFSNTGLSNLAKVTAVTGAVPTAVITSPADGTSITAGKNMEILVTAEDTDGSVTAVVVSNSSSPDDDGIVARPTGNANEYLLSFPTSPSALGNFNLVASVTDNQGNVGLSEIVPINVVLGTVPQIEILSPQPGDKFFINQPFIISARITDADGIITSAIFEEDGEIRSERQLNNNGDERDVIVEASRSFTGVEVMAATSTPDEYEFVATLDTPDLVGLKIKAFDDDGNFTVSREVKFTVTSGIAPDATITAITPPAGVGSINYTLGEIVTIDIDALDIDGSISEVKVFNGITELGTANLVSAGKYRYNYTTDTTGQVELSVRATDDRNNVGISDFSTINIVSGAIPTLTIDSPDSSSAVSIFNLGDVIPFEITASDPDGSISSVSVSDLSNGTQTTLGQALKIDSDNNDQYRYSLNTALLTAGTKFISVIAVDNRGNVSTDLVEIRLDVVPFSVNFVTQTVTNTATNTTTTPTASPYVIEGATGEYSSASRPFTVEIGGIDPSTLKSLDWQLQLDDGSAPVSVSETLVATAEGNGQTTEENGQEGSVAASSTYTQSFEFSSAGTLTVTATNTSGVVVQNSLTVFIDLPEPVTDLTDFIKYIYNQVQGAVPSAVSVDALIVGEQYEIVTVGTTDFATLGPVPVDEDSLIPGQTYQIVTEGTDFTTAGAPSNAVGTVFTAGPIASTGSTGTAIDISVGTVFTSNGTAGSGTGTVRSEVIAAIDAINILGGDTPANRAAFAATLFPSDQYNDSRYQTVALVYKTLTGQWPNQAQLETGFSTILQDTAAESNQTTVPLSGSITAGSTQILNFNYSQGDQVTITVTGDGTNANPLTDATLTVSAPDGSFVGYSDDNFLSGNFSLDPVVSFVASQTGAYTVTVGGYNSFQSGDFVATSTSTAIESNTEILSARALVESLKGAYNGANGFLADAATTSLLSPAFVAQIYLNKHGVGITAQNAAILGSRLIGDNVTIGTGDILSGYQSNVVNFVADFARDVDLVAYGPYASATTDEGYHYTGNLYYGRPNNPLPSWYQARAEIQSDANLNSALSAFLGIQNPTASDLAPYAGMTFEEALALIFASDEFDAQFAGDTASSDTDGDGYSNYQEVLLGTDPDDGSVAPSAVDLQVALYMLSLGVDDGDKVALDDDADADGVSNYAEILLNTDPSDGSVAPTTADSFVAQRMIDLGVVDSSLVSASDDADGDGVSNIAEILLNTNPSNTNDEPTASGSSSIEGTDFVFEFVRLKSSLTPIGASVVVECADETFTFAPVSAVDLQTNLSLSADQTGMTSDYERVEYRVDTSSIGCNFFRLLVQ